MPRRVLVRMKKLRRFLDDRIESARERLSEASPEEGDGPARSRIEAFQEVREEFVGERLEPAEPDEPEERSA